MPYSLDKKKQIFIFGKSVRAEDLSNNLRKNAFNKLYICSGELDTVCQEVRANENDIWIIAFLNARKHKEYAKKLHNKGFNKIIFLPTDEAVKWESAIRIRQIYNYLLYGGVEKELQVPYYDEIIREPIDTSNAVISEECGLITFYARVNSLFVDNDYKKYNKSGYAISLVAVEHYRSMYEKMAGLETDETYYREYCEEQKFTEKVCKEKTLDRYQLYHLFKSNINRGDFFSASASIVKGNKNGVLHIKEGLHRAVFLMMQGWSYIPATISIKEFEAIYPTERILKIREFFEENHIKKTVTPISHPAFYNFPAEKEVSEPSVLTAIKRFWGVGGFRGKKILDISDYNSYFARNVGRVLWDYDEAMIESRETDELQFQLAALYNDLLNIQNVKVEFQPMLQLESSYDIVFLLGKMKFGSKNIDFLMDLDRYVQDAVVFECDLEDCEEQVRLFTENTEFRKHTFLHQYFNGITARKVLVFEKVSFKA